MGTRVATGFEQPLRLERVNDHICALVGPLGNRAPRNLGNNATSGVTATGTGALLIDSRGSSGGAEARSIPFLFCSAGMVFLYSRGHFN